jgi:hypothetical protein
MVNESCGAGSGEAIAAGRSDRVAAAGVFVVGSGGADAGMKPPAVVVPRGPGSAPAPRFVRAIHRGFRFPFLGEGDERRSPERPATDEVTARGSPLFYDAAWRRGSFQSGLT